jgi:catechol 2,3-dioxygenase-like lactoylglutathione lyase family enzyme
MGIQLGQIGQIAVPVPDLAAAVAFYRDLLGIEFLFQVPGLAFFNCQGVRLMLSVPETPEFERPGSVIYYRVPEIEEAYRTLSERGVEFIDEPHRVAEMEDHDLWMVFFRDPARNVLALMSEVPRSEVKGAGLS